MERANTSMDSWIQETCYMSAVTSGPNKPNNINELWNHQSPNDKGKSEKQSRKNYIVWKTRKFGEPYVKQMCQNT